MAESTFWVLSCGTMVKTMSFSGSMGMPQSFLFSRMPVPRPGMIVPPSAPADFDALTTISLPPLFTMLTIRSKGIFNSMPNSYSSNG